MTQPPSSPTEDNESSSSKWRNHHLFGDKYYSPTDPPLLLVYVSEPLKEGSGLSARTTYLVTTTVVATKKSYCVRRRYKEFKKLFEEVTKLRGVNLSSFPKKKLKKFHEDVIEERRLSFEIILREMAEYHQVVINPSFRKFVEVPLNVNIFPSNFCINSYVSRRKTTISPRGAPSITTNTVTSNNASSSQLSEETSPTVTIISSQIIADTPNNDQAVDQVIVEADQSITLTQPEESQITAPITNENECTPIEANNTCEESSGEANNYQEHNQIISQLSAVHLQASHNSTNTRKSTDMPYYQLKMEAGSSKLLDMNPEERVQEILRQIKSETMN
ncbi:hypothetical protein C9374_000819 [Naegleria lovaniensis]|uniref:PX domain-containing protein n=1 Tax=Naegleria lovaniensis TaxID=51637 RepID=A0AA88KNF3_NAELO|nr:uncharacterized protein C9374_000819 [Naegleria lovaniensis]KAG2387969.1 hypothetical protein C9374_000819 [Naegleria lovaniensis]